ncbi:hypothetical protein E2C01_014105 [Portunus trituberculatus]|uniref:Uncharacterized protein n=1 Tax=Portunus trituberculatus TaxID=210409 RepID=A0A5B7DJ86_PORTR|nr:hypothetical protein [Portunus trituberculatus]
MEQGVGVESRQSGIQRTTSTPEWYGVSSKGWSGLRLARHGYQETGSGPPKRTVSRASRENTSGGRGKSRVGSVDSARGQENLPSLGLVSQASGRKPEFSAGDGTSKIRNVKQR